jgi:capsule polysaccharide modification protein KpsS
MSDTPHIRIATEHAADVVGPPDFGIRRALLLQGPMGPFFRRFARELEQLGIAVTKLNFNAGDDWYFRGALHYHGELENFPSYLSELIAARRIDGIYLFGDGRPFHRKAIELAKKLGIRVFVFEEGYLRPDWITLELGGVNGHSSMPRDPEFFRAQADKSRESLAPHHVGITFRYGGWYSTVYSILLTLGFPFYPRYVHHRPLNFVAEAYRWVLGGARKLYYRNRERGIEQCLVQELAQRYFVVTLQVHCDYQLQHSRFASVEQFIEHVVASFAEHAPRDNLLVVKHHPLDRPYRDYTRLLNELTQKHGLGKRLLYIHDQHLPTLLSHARGTIMINSTVGLQAALQRTPVKVLGFAVYDMPGVTHQGSLRDFWHEPGEVDVQVVQGFRNYLLATNQANGNFYKRLSAVDSPTGVRWRG